jgi:hypothetical protein
MMQLDDCKVMFCVVGLAGVLLLASPTLSFVWHLPGGERFSEFWILGPGHMAEDYPFNVKADELYSIYVGVANHMGSSSYYTAYVKFRTQSEPLPNVTAGTPSPLSPLYEYRAFLEDGATWEVPLTFSFSGVSFFNNQSLVTSLTVDDHAFGVDKSASWDGENNGYYYQLFLELWIYQVGSDAFEFHNRFVGLWLNMTSV